MASVNKEKNRYPGIRPFAEEDISLFFGREKDSDDLTRKIFIKQVVVLYGKSGYGKSSLINAGIIPELKKNDEWIYFPIRFNNYSEKESGLNFSPVQTVKQRFSENIKANLNAEFSRLLPDEDSFWYWIKQNQLLTKKNKFIIFFDQFEELFTYSKDEVANFSELLSELLYGVVPNAYRKRLEELNQKGSAVDLYDFIYDKPEVKVVFSIRSDRLSQMNVLTDRHPTILQYCYELDALSTEDAIQAITGPAKINEPGFKSPTFEYDELAVAKIIDSIANPIDNKIESATLQIVCRYVEDVLVLEHRNTLITEGLLGNITEIFTQYYESTLSKLNNKERQQAQQLIEDELIDVDRRNTLTEGYIRSKFGISLDLLNILEQSSLLRKERDASGRVLYEIGHDSLINAINRVADERRRLDEEQKTILLQQQIEDEKKRSAQLLKAKKTAVNSAWLAAILATAAIFFVFKAEIAKRNEIEQRKKVQESYKSLNTQKKITTEKERIIEEGKKSLELEKQAAKVKEQYGNKIYLYTKNLMSVETSLTAIKDFVESDPDYAKKTLNQERKKIENIDSLPKELQLEKKRILQKINDLDKDIKTKKNGN